MNLSRWLGWWYLAISVGFAFLALSHIITHGKMASVVLRMIMSAGFGMLAYMELKAKKRR